MTRSETTLPSLGDTRDLSRCFTIPEDESNSAGLTVQRWGVENVGAHVERGAAVRERFNREANFHAGLYHAGKRVGLILVLRLQRRSKIADGKPNRERDARRHPILRTDVESLCAPGDACTIAAKTAALVEAEEDQFVGEPCAQTRTDWCGVRERQHVVLVRDRTRAHIAA